LPSAVERIPLALALLQKRKLFAGLPEQTGAIGFSSLFVGRIQQVLKLLCNDG
jgi:hypothetical protein